MIINGESSRKRGRQINPAARKTFSSDLLLSLDDLIHESKQRVRNMSWPSTKYIQDPVGFCRDILGFDPWEKERELLESVRDYNFVAVRAGQKLSKSHGAMAAALWAYCCGYKVRMTSATFRQVESVLFSQLVELHRGAGICVECAKLSPQPERPCEHSSVIDVDVAKTSTKGIRPKTAGQTQLIQGFSSATTEGLGGYSGVNQLWILDESSGIDDGIHEAVEGNLIAGGKLLAISNPTKTHGWFYELFKRRDSKYKLIHISSYDSPNVKARRTVIPGLATLESIEYLKREYGEKSALFRVRVLGEFDDLEEGKIFDVETLTQSHAVNDEPDDDSPYVLSIGLDPAGPSGRGDDSALVAIRGKRMLRCQGLVGLDENGHLELVQRWFDELLKPGEVGYLTIDREGAVGARVYGFIKGWSEQHATPRRWWCRGVRSSDAAQRKPQLFGLVRDELCDAVFHWIKNGGGLLQDTKLEKDLQSLVWVPDEDRKGRTRLASKKELHKILGRSPDRYDALSMAVWNGYHVPGERAVVQSAPTATAGKPNTRVTIDPFTARNIWTKR